MEGDQKSTREAHLNLNDNFQVYKVLSKGPEQLYSSCVALLSMIASLRRIDEIVSLHQISSTDEDTILDLNARCTTILSSLESGLTRFKSIQTDMLGLFDANNQIEELVNEQSSILEGLQERCVLYCAHSRCSMASLICTSISSFQACDVISSIGMKNFLL